MDLAVRVRHDESVSKLRRDELYESQNFQKGRKVRDSCNSSLRIEGFETASRRRALVGERIQPESRTELPSANLAPSGLRSNAMKNLSRQTRPSGPKVQPCHCWRRAAECPPYPRSLKFSRRPRSAPSSVRCGASAARLQACGNGLANWLRCQTTGKRTGKRGTV
jgi:hypothetical protein